MSKVLLFFALSVLALNADFLNVSSSITKLNEFKYVTPQGNEIKIPKDVKLIIVSFEKDTGALVNEYLNTKSSDYLTKYNSIFIADINKMPSVITKMFALPKLRKYKHPMYLNYDEKFEQSVLGKEEMVTLLHVENSIIKHISFIVRKEELKAAIEK
ncbi:MAG: hypothetical protein Q8N78_08765 [Sulfurimonas sp.]|jgi:hypothetical protein|nr:hypothetical protein [Sulfurimonas sp.]